MTALLQRLHARLISPGRRPSRSDAYQGCDFWWYSLMLFIASRAADGLNIFVGLWLVPFPHGCRRTITYRSLHHFNPFNPC